MKSITTLRALVLCAGLAVAIDSPIFGAEPSVADQISSRPLFSSALKWVGQEPPADESSELLRAISFFDTDRKAGLVAAETFLKEHPDSGWTPSLRVNLAEFYRSQGSYSRALHHWEVAWDVTKLSKDPATQRIAVRSIAGWTRLLASLGRKDELNLLFKELKDLQLPLGSLSTYIEATQEGLIMMNASPSSSYRCGSFALGRVAAVLQLGTNVSRALYQTPSPDGGFRMSQLLELAETNGLSVDAVRRPAGGDIVVPSVVHWKLNHYAAIVEQKDGRYKVIDSTFGKTHSWIDAATIDAEASGAFLVPRSKSPSAWAKLSKTECDSIYGKGFPNYIPDESDCNAPCDCNDNDEESEEPPAANDGPADGETPDSEECDEELAEASAGMPVWRVSEPYATLWLIDTPLRYRLSSGKWMSLQLKYKSRGESKIDTMGGFGPFWECNWLGFLHQESDVYDANVAGGGHESASNDALLYKSGRRFVTGTSGGGSGAMDVGGTSVPTMIGPLGSKNGYAFKALLAGATNHFLTHRMDRYGRITEFKYETNGTIARMTSVIDKDGRSITVSYHSGTNAHLIGEVTDPYGRSARFYYTNQLLTHIVDTAGMSTYFEYDGNNRITNMITLYGTNSFQQFTGIDDSYRYGGYQRRALLVTEATRDKQLYSYTDNGYDGARKSYHWNRAQYEAISDTGKTNFLDMLDEDYMIASVKEWAHGPFPPEGSGYTESVSDTIEKKAPPLISGGSRNWTTYTHMSTIKRVTSVSSAQWTRVSIDRNTKGRPLLMSY
jgi:hypothetical protein